MELPKLDKLRKIKEKIDPVIDWLEFIDSDSKEGMEMLAKKNENIKSAYHILQKVSKNKEARMAYEARQAEIMDQLTREKTAKEEGRAEGKTEVVIKLLLKKFKSVPQDYIDKIKTSPEDVVENIATDIFDIEKVEDLEKYLKTR